MRRLWGIHVALHSAVWAAAPAIQCSRVVEGVSTLQHVTWGACGPESVQPSATRLLYNPDLMQPLGYTTMTKVGWYRTIPKTWKTEGKTSLCIVVPIQCDMPSTSGSKLGIGHHHQIYIDPPKILTFSRPSLLPEISKYNVNCDSSHCNTGLTSALQALCVLWAVNSQPLGFCQGTASPTHPAVAIAEISRLLLLVQLPVPIPAGREVQSRGPVAHMVWGAGMQPAGGQHLDSPNVTVPA